MRDREREEALSRLPHSLFPVPSFFVARGSALVCFTPVGAGADVDLEMIVHRHAGPMTVRPVALEQAKVHDLVIRQHRVRCLPVVKLGRKWTRPEVAAMVLDPEVAPRPSLRAALQPMLQWHRQEIRHHASRRNLSLRSRRSAKRPWPAAIRWEVSLN